jgi:hypothetical protein
MPATSARSVIAPAGAASAIAMVSRTPAVIALRVISNPFR